MYTLFISTYNYLITIGILKDGKKITVKEVESVKNHSIYLIPTIKNVLSDNNIEIKDINEIIVINGPGSFTGVRLGVTVAKTLAYTLNIKIKTITSIDALAVSDNTLEGKTVIIKDNKGFYNAMYENNILISDIKYSSNSEFDNFNNNNETIINSTILDIEKIYNFCKEKANINPHEVNPIYIKEIEVLK